jgi:hypothetical protein
MIVPIICRSGKAIIRKIGYEVKSEKVKNNADTLMPDGAKLVVFLINQKDYEPFGVGR